MGTAAVEYAQARLQARYGLRPGESAWAELRGIQEFPTLLERARTLGFSAWVSGLHADSDVHGIELGLRTRLRTHVAEVAHWMPETWRPAVLWCGLLVDLPVLGHVLAGQEIYSWMRQDSALKTFVAEGGASSEEALRTGELAPLAVAYRGGVPLLSAWLTEWRLRWPSNADRTPLEELVKLVQSHLDAFSRTTPASTWMLRLDLETKLRLLFRRTALHPAAAFAYLALVALEMERLRAELVGGLLFAQRVRHDASASRYLV